MAQIFEMPRTRLIGEKGGGKGGGGGSVRTPEEAPNTLRSNSMARIIDMLGEGVIGGLVNGHQSIFIDGTPLQNSDGTYNFQGAVVSTREGLPDQDYIPGFPAVETEYNVDVQVRQATPVVRSISSASANAVRVRLMIPRLLKQSKEKNTMGDLQEYSVQVAVDVQSGANGAWKELVRDNIKGKTTSRYEKQYRVPLEGSGPFQIRMRRVSGDSDEESTLENDTYFAGYTEIVDHKLMYPDSAMIGLELSAQQFGSSIPTRMYQVKGRIISVPSNYDPVARTYSGVWDGTFKKAVTSNPAWVVYDLMTNTRFGVGLPNVDKWQLYQIGRYCDELVDDGFGGKEPRYTFNAVINDEDDAFSAIQQFCSVFRGKAYWAADTVRVIADMPKDPVKLVSAANVRNGDFDYGTTNEGTIHSVAVISYNNPETGEEELAVYEDAEQIRNIGYRKLQMKAFGCNSRAAAIRMGKWAIDSEKNQTETIQYQANVDHAGVGPGDIIKVADKNYAEARMGGRLKQVGDVLFQLDHIDEFVDEQGSSVEWFIDITMPNDTIERREVAAFRGDLGSVVQVSSPLSQAVNDDAMWLLSSREIEPRQFLVQSVSEDETGWYTISGLIHDPTKYARIEQGIFLEQPNYTTLPTGPVAPPLNITLETYTYSRGTSIHQGLTISWTASDDPRAERYQCQVLYPTTMNYQDQVTGDVLSTDIPDAPSGEYSVRVRSISGLGVPSPWAIQTSVIANLLEPYPITGVEVNEGSFSISLRPLAQVEQEYEFWRSDVALDNVSLIEVNARKIGEANFLSDGSLKPGTTYYYYLRATNLYGFSDWYPVQASTLADFDEIIAEVEENLSQPGRPLDQLKSGLLDNAQAISDARQEFETGLGEASDQLSAAQGRIDEVSSIAGSNAEQVDILGQEVLTLTGRTDDAEAEITETQRVARLNSQLEAFESKASQVQTAAGAAAYTVERIQRVSEDEALSQVITEVDARLSGSIASVRTQVTSLVTTSEALADSLTKLTADFGDTTAEFESRITALSTTTEGLVAETSRLSTALDDAEASIDEVRRVQRLNAQLSAFESKAMQVQTTAGAAEAKTQQIVSASGRQALAQQITELDTRFGTSTASINSQLTTLSTQTSANATRQDTFEAQVGDQFGSVQQSIGTIIDPDVGVVSQALTTVEVNGNRGIVGIQAFGESIQFVAVADQFAVYNPIAGEYVLAFVITDGRVVIPDARIDKVTITKLIAADGSLAFVNGKLRADLIEADKLKVQWANIQNVSIGSAQIQNGAIGTAQVLDGSLSRTASNSIINTRRNDIAINESSAGWFNVIDTNFDPLGASVSITGEFCWDYYYKPRTSSNPSAPSFVLVAELRLVINGAEVARWNRDYKNSGRFQDRAEGASNRDCFYTSENRQKTMLNDGSGFRSPPIPFNFSIRAGAWSGNRNVRLEMKLYDVNNTGQNDSFYRRAYFYDCYIESFTTLK